MTYQVQTGPSGIAAIEDVGEPSDDWPEPDETEEKTED